MNSERIGSTAASADSALTGNDPLASRALNDTEPPEHSSSSPSDAEWPFRWSQLRPFMRLYPAVSGLAVGLVAVVAGAELEQLPLLMLAALWTCELVYHVGFIVIVPVKKRRVPNARRTFLLWLGPSFSVLALLVKHELRPKGQEVELVVIWAASRLIALPIFWGLAPFVGEWEEAITGRSPEP